MKTVRIWLLAFAAGTSAFSAVSIAQTPPAELGARHVPAPWWMREPVIASIGYVRTEIPANRAQFSAQFSSVARTAAGATEDAAARIRELDKALRGLGAERVRLETTFSTRPLYEQYREKDGTLVDNQRADKIDRYEVTANLRIEARDVAVLERAYATVLAAKPSSVQPVGFRLEPGNETKTWLFSEAVKDAAKRARLAAEAAGSRLGPAKVIDPTGRACQTDVLAGWPRYSTGGNPTDVPSLGLELPPPPADAPAPITTQTAVRQEAGGHADAVEAMHVTLQPPMHELTAEACVVYGLQ